MKVGSHKSRKLKVRNKGKFPLQVTVGTLASPFTVTSGSGTFTLSKGKSKNVKVEFAPTVTGPALLQILSITSDDPNHPSANITATGSGK